jgi:hypothetical protein
MVEKQLNVMIQRRTRKRKMGPDEREELWQESVRALHRPQARGDEDGMVRVPPRTGHPPQSRPRGPHSLPRGVDGEADGRTNERGPMSTTDKMGENLKKYRVCLEETQEASWRPLAYSSAGESSSQASEAAE